MLPKKLNICINVAALLYVQLLSLFSFPFFPEPGHILPGSRDYTAEYARQ